MYKKIIVLLFIMFTFLSVNISYSATPDVNCAWLPWCANSTSITTPSKVNIANNIWAKFMSKFIWEFIQIVAVFAVFALIFSGIMYLLSAWEEEKANKAKKWIIWSLVWVFVSISAWWIINFLNNIRIG